MPLKVKTMEKGGWWHTYLDCCAPMKQAWLPKTHCTPHIATYEGHREPFISSCDGDLADLPLNFCPWCGTSLKDLDWSGLGTG
jgi:hypothetical protein